MKRWAMKIAGDDRILWPLGSNVEVAERRARKDMGSGYERVLDTDGNPLSIDEAATWKSRVDELRRIGLI